MLNAKRTFPSLLLQYYIIEADCIPDAMLSSECNWYLRSFLPFYKCSTLRIQWILFFEWMSSEVCAETELCRYWIIGRVFTTQHIHCQTILDCGTSFSFLSISYQSHTSCSENQSIFVSFSDGWQLSWLRCNRNWPRTIITIIILDICGRRRNAVVCKLSIIFSYQTACNCWWLFKWSIDGFVCGRQF